MDLEPAIRTWGLQVESLPFERPPRRSRRDPGAAEGAGAILRPAWQEAAGSPLRTVQQWPHL